MTERRAVLVSLENDGDKVRVRLDDAIGGQGGVWRQDVHVTHKSYDSRTLENMGMLDEELADLGLYILARLNANSST